MTRGAIAYHILRELGPGWCLARAMLAARARLGLVQRATPMGSWDDWPLASLLGGDIPADPSAYAEHRSKTGPAFLFDESARGPLRRALADLDSGCPSAVAEADALLDGRFIYFGRHSVELGSEPDWHRNAFSGQIAPRDQHWSEVTTFGLGDIKAIWEPSRFGFTYPLVRAYLRTGDERYAERFWELLESWRAANPPNLGANWKCGQEATFRLMAWCFALYGLAGAEATTDDRIASLGQMAGFTAHRIEAHVDYALSQRNNHGISEAVGLLTVGLLFPEMKNAARWEAAGRDLLEDQCRRLIYDDGSFCQHSVVYHRLMLHDVLWAIRLAERNARPLSSDLRARVTIAAEWLERLVDPVTGRVPHYGSCDGSNILPLSACDYLDFRPVVQAAWVVLKDRRRYGPGPWDEEAYWISGRADLGEARPSDGAPNFQCAEGGYHVLASDASRSFVRCADFRRGHRPAHLDQLHVDVTWRGQGIAIDPGTLSYNHPGIEGADLASSRVHNTVTVDGASQAERISHFLALPWPQGLAGPIHVSRRGGLALWQGWHDGYQRLPEPVTHGRAVIRLGDEHWCVLDRLVSDAPHRYRLHWLLADFEHRLEGSRLTLMTPSGDYHVLVGADAPEPDLSLVRGDPGSTRGWWSPYYYERQPALSLALEAESPILHFWTVFGPAQSTVEPGENMIRLVLDGGVAEVRLRPDDEPLPVGRVTYRREAYPQGVGNP
ncbi:MAG: hypothetical protein GF320_16785 [Armatimonadia bacterium]|nr:hypothetical protein [Armatimonadia bacterium]